MTSRDLRHLLFALTAVGLLCVVPILAGAPLDLLLGAPVVLLALPLLSGRYLGEEALRRLAASVGRRCPRRAARSLLPRLRLGAATPRFGALLAFSLAVRPPPAPARPH